MQESIALAAIGLASATVGGLIWVVKYAVKTLSKELREHTKASVKQAEASKKQTDASEEMLQFMKNLNGKLEGAVIAKAIARAEGK